MKIEISQASAERLWDLVYEDRAMCEDILWQDKPTDENDVKCLEARIEWCTTMLALLEQAKVEEE